MCKEILLFLLFFLLAKVELVACLNGELVRLNDGSGVYYETEIEHYHFPFGHRLLSEQELVGTLGSLKSKWFKSGDIAYYSDYGLVLILLKRYEDAIKVYEEIERIDPNRYSTASNIGTAYELTGNDSLALYWIKRAIQIDPKSHFGSEWIHQRILEAKLCGDSCINGKFILGVDFGDDPNPNFYPKFDTIEHFRESLFYQLDERLTFVKPKDKVVAVLLFELLNLNLWMSGSGSLEDYIRCAKYGYPLDKINLRYQYYCRISGNQYRPITEDDIRIKKENEIENERIKESIDKIVERRNPKNNVSTIWSLVGGFSVVSLSFVTVFLVRRKKRNNK